MKVWEEGANTQLAQRAIFQRSKYSRSIKLPLIIWAHPMGSSDAIDSSVNCCCPSPHFRTASRSCPCPHSRRPVADGGSPEKLLSELLCFFIKYKPLGATQFIPNITPDGETRRLSAMQSYKDNRRPEDPPFFEPATCGMSEEDAWNWAL